MTSSDWCHASAKIAPLMALITFVVLHGASLRKKDAYGWKYSVFIFLGLAFCAAGDVCLVFKKNYFLLGIALFGVGHVMYIAAFGFDNFQWKLGVVLVLYAVCFWKYVTKKLKGVMVGAVGIYAFIISLMIWRAISRVERASDLKTSWTRMCSCIGACFFALSDTIIAINQFMSPVWWSNQLIMSTYYMAQLGIALSVVDCQSKQRGMNLKRLMKSSTVMFRFERFPASRQSKARRMHDANQHVTFASRSVSPSSKADSPSSNVESPNSIKIVRSLTDSASPTELASPNSMDIVETPTESAALTSPMASFRSRTSAKTENSDAPSVKLDKASLSCDSLADSIRDLDRKKSDSKKSFSICTMFMKKKTEGETISRDASKRLGSKQE